MNDPALLKDHIRWLKEALAIAEPYHGRYVGRIAEWADVRTRLDKTDGAGRGYLKSSWFLNNDGAPRVDVMGAKAELEAQERALAAIEKHRSDPRFSRMNELADTLQKEMEKVRTSMSREEYMDALRAGAFPRVSFH